MSKVLEYIFNCIGSALPLCILCLCLATILNNKTMSKKSLASFAIISVIMFIILLRT